MLMITKRKAYWLLQIFGWIGLFSIGLVNRTISFSLIQNVIVFSVFGILLSHLLRLVIIKSSLVSKNYYSVILQAILLSFIFSILFVVFRHFYLMIVSSLSFDIGIVELLNIAVYFLVWQFFYLGFSLVEKNRREEVNNLKLIAINNEIELRNLKTQLNPHFLFNALNSVRALIDEDSAKAKESVGLISNILRAVLISDKKELCTIREELELVSNYLQVEKVRFEERLHYKINIPEGLNNFRIPPFIIQLLVENAIKHGISKRIQPGEITIDIREIDSQLMITVSNDISQNNVQVESTGIGIQNLCKRLDIIYNDKAIFNFIIENKAVATIKIPLYK